MRHENARTNARIMYTAARFSRPSSSKQVKERPSGKTTFKTKNFSVMTISFSSGKIRYNAIRSNSFREEDTSTSDFFFPRNNNSRLCKTVPVAFLRNHMILQCVLLCFFPNLEIIFPVWYQNNIKTITQLFVTRPLAFL